MKQEKMKAINDVNIMHDHTWPCQQRNITNYGTQAVIGDVPNCEAYVTGDRQIHEIGDPVLYKVVCGWFVKTVAGVQSVPHRGFWLWRLRLHLVGLSCCACTHKQIQSFVV